MICSKQFIKSDAAAVILDGLVDCGLLIKNQTVIC